jgi:histidinol-phosphate aminotransferase
MCGCGSEDLLHMLIKTMCRAGDEIIMPKHGFGVYAIASNAIDAKAVLVPYNADMCFLAADVLNLITERTRMICIDHPGNPMGTYLPTVELDTLVRNIPSHVTLVIDAAYAEYMKGAGDYTDGMGYVALFPNVVVTRSFSKAYGLAGLRLGWLYGGDAVIEHLEAMRVPFKTSGIAQAAGIAALQDGDFVAKTVAYATKHRVALEDVLAVYGILAHKGCANFALARFKSAEEATDFKNYLNKNNIHVMQLVQYGLPEIIRISIGKKEGMTYLQETIARFMEL